MAQGWICLHRKILDSDIWGYDCESYTKREAWIYILLNTSRKDHKCIINNTIVTVNRGEYLVSLRYLATAWRWSVNKVRRYLTLLEGLSMITTKTEKNGTRIIVVNYSVYQDFFEDSEYKDEYTNGTPTEHQRIQNTTKETRVTKGNNNNYICAFDDFWKIYPRKNDKAKAYKCYQARLKDGYTEDQLLTACKNYAAECAKNKTEQKYIKHGATFLSVNEPFLDYLKGDNNGSDSTGNTTADEDYTAIDETIRRIESGEADHDDDGLWD